MCPFNVLEDRKTIKSYYGFLFWKWYVSIQNTFQKTIKPYFCFIFHWILLNFFAAKYILVLDVLIFMCRVISKENSQWCLIWNNRVIAANPIKNNTNLEITFLRLWFWGTATMFFWVSVFENWHSKNHKTWGYDPYGFMILWFFEHRMDTLLMTSTSHHSNVTA